MPDELPTPKICVGGLLPLFTKSNRERQFSMTVLSFAKLKDCIVYTMPPTRRPFLYDPILSHCSFIKLLQFRMSMYPIPAMPPHCERFFMESSDAMMVPEHSQSEIRTFHFKMSDVSYFDGSVVSMYPRMLPYWPPFFDFVLMVYW